MKYRISWPDNQRKYAHASGKSLFAIGYDVRPRRMEVYGPCEDTRAAIAFRVAHLIYMGNSLDEAVEKTKEGQRQFEKDHPEKKDPEDIACVRLGTNSTKRYASNVTD